MTPPIDVRERPRLCDLMLEVGPEAPTLCEGWTVADLAAHLVLREHFHRTTASAVSSQVAAGLPKLVARLREQPPLPWRVPWLREYVTGFELFVHHEDVRRANGLGPRPSNPDLEDICWRLTRLFGRRIARSVAPFGLDLVAGDGHRRTFRSDPAATITGRPSEITLFLTGRRSAADVTVTGPVEAIHALDRANLGI